MDQNTFGIMLLYFLMPGHLEYLLHLTTAQGNMGLNGVFGEIYIKRNLLYSGPIWVFLWNSMGYPMYGIVIFITLLASFVYTCNKWKNVILISPINKMS